MANLAGVVLELKKERAYAQKKVEQLDAAIKVLGGLAGLGRRRPRRKISAAGRRRIAEAQRARWAKVRRQNKTR